VAKKYSFLKKRVFQTMVPPLINNGACSVFTFHFDSICGSEVLLLQYLLQPAAAESVLAASGRASSFLHGCMGVN
jgi:hypothetical protein